MKKLIALLILSPILVSEELKLTCEAGPQIWFIGLHLDGTEAYYFHHNIPKIDSPETLTPELINESIFEEKNLFKKYWIYPSYFQFNDVNRIRKGGTVNIVINRLTLKGRIGTSNGDLPLAADCFKGFKSYEKKI
tara:strand:+ start:64 stop:468 length:405 start_codon:yes stop_codon:yes gene_type:complete